MHQDCSAKNEIIKIRMENASIISITYETPRRFKKILQYSTELFANIRLTFANKRIFYAKMTPNFRQKKTPHNFRHYTRIKKFGILQPVSDNEYRAFRRKLLPSDLYLLFIEDISKMFIM